MQGKLFKIFDVVQDGVAETLSGRWEAFPRVFQDLFEVR